MLKEMMEYGMTLEDLFEEFEISPEDFEDQGLTKPLTHSIIKLSKERNR